MMENNKTILHISSDYSNQGLYKNMVESLALENNSQIVFVPVRSKEELNKYAIKDNPSVSIHYKHILKKYHRFLFHLKINTIVKSILTAVNFNKIDIIHAHFLFSDGAVALKLKQKYKIPYVVSVRNTDVNTFFKYMFFLRKKGLKIMLEAKHIVFLNEAYKKQVLKKYVPNHLHEEIEKKSHIVPNGLADFWIQNTPSTPKQKTDKIKLLYVGDFTPNKNVPLILEAVKSLHLDGVNIHLTLVGGGGNDSEKTMRLIQENKVNYITYHKRTNSKEELLKHYQANNLFLMPSFHETFGIVYLEAMSQGIPILYSKEQGVDGYFKTNPPGYAVNPHDLKDVIEKIGLAHKNMETLSENALLQVKQFTWNKIANKLTTLYFD